MVNRGAYISSYNYHDYSRLISFNQGPPWSSNTEICVYPKQEFVEYTIMVTWNYYAHTKLLIISIPSWRLATHMHP